MGMKYTEKAVILPPSTLSASLEIENKLSYDVPIVNYIHGDSFQFNGNKNITVYECEG